MYFLCTRYQKTYNMRILSAIILAFLLTSCGSKKAVIGEDFNITMQKGSCFGSCPVYTITIDKKGYAIYDGERFTDKIGKHGMQIAPDKFQAIAQAFGDAGLASFDDDYPSNIADLPSATIAYVNNSFSKRITGKVERPQKVKDLQAMLEELAQMDAWISLEPKEELVEKVDEKDLIKNEIIIKFAPGTFISKWMKQFKDYSLYVQKPLDDARTTWLTHFNDKKIDPERLLAQIKQDPAVENAEFNKKVEKR